MNKEYKIKAEYIKECIGGNIRRIRLNNNLEVKQLCSDLELSQAAYSNIERGVTDINISRLMQLADYFGVHYVQILTANDGISSKVSQNSSHLKSAIANADSFQLIFEQIKAENLYLKEQISQLLNMLGAK